MECVKLYKLYQRLPSPLKVLDRLLFSEPFIEKCSTFEMKTFLTSYSIIIGIYFDSRVNKNTRRIIVTYYILGSLVEYISSIYYLTDLKVPDVESLAMPIIAMSMTSIKFVFWWFNHYFYDIIERLVEFLIDDCDRSNSVMIPEEIRDNGSIKVKRWVILVASIFFGFYIAGNVFFDPEIDTKMSGLTEGRYLMKFFPLWCPFENLWLKRGLSFLQDAIVLPELCMNSAGVIALLTTSIEIHNKFKKLIQKMKLSSERTFERMESLDKALEETTFLKNERIRSKDIKCLEEEKISTMEIFYQDFVSYIKRYQQLHRVQLFLNNFLDFLCSGVYCFTLVGTIGFGFVCVEALSNDKIEFDAVLRMLIWSLVAGCVWFLCCVVGNLFSEQNDTFADEVYSMPWYYFSPKERKTVLTLLAVTQRPTSLRALKLVEVNKNTFPQFLDTVYSYVQIMQTLQRVKHSHI